MRKQYSNEELVKYIQEGHEIYLELLWSQVERFVAMKANERLMKAPPHIRDIYFDDIYQSGYFAMVDAAKIYNPDKEAGFLTYLELHLRNKFNEALGMRTAQGRNDPMRTAQSLNEPLPDSEEYTLEDVISDPHSDDGYNAIVEEAFQDDVNFYVLKAINSLPDEEYKKYFLIFLGCNCNRSETRRKLGWDIPKARKIYDKGILQLRRFMISKKKEWEVIGIDELLGLRAYRGGLGSFINNRFTSSTEEAVFKLLELESAEDEIFSLSARTLEDEED